jgi:peptidyl-prolyl cis-trans isomerase C
MEIVIEKRLVYAIILLTIIGIGFLIMKSEEEIISEEPAPEKITAAHILVETEDEAENVITRLDNGESFSDLAMELSLCPSKSRGGNLGEFGKGVMVEEFETAAFNLRVGEISDPIQTQFGWHIIKRLA